MLLNYEQIRMDGGTQPRAALQKEVMEEYADLMRAGVKFPPLVVFHDGENYWLADGFHRMGAALRASPADPIEVEVIQGSLSDAQWYSLGVNKTHGLRRTPEDRKRAIRTALAHPTGRNMSDREIAEHVGCHFETVAKHRKDMEASATIGKTDSRTGRDGRTIRTAKIGKATKRRRTGTGVKLARKTTLLRGHSLPNPMISLSLPPHNPVIAAATICNLFEPPFIKTLIEELTQRMKGLES